jgi:hypothetical protein
LQGLPTGLSGLSAPGLNGEYGYEIESGCSLEWLVWLMMMYVAICKVSTGFYGLPALWLTKGVAMNT